jgi:hypothetical protein
MNNEHKKKVGRPSVLIDPVRFMACLERHQRDYCAEKSKHAIEYIRKLINDDIKKDERKANKEKPA